MAMAMDIYMCICMCVHMYMHMRACAWRACMHARPESLQRSRSRAPQARVDGIELSSREDAISALTAEIENALGRLPWSGLMATALNPGASPSDADHGGRFLARLKEMQVGAPDTATRNIRCASTCVLRILPLDAGARGPPCTDDAAVRAVVGACALMTRRCVWSWARAPGQGFSPRAGHLGATGSGARRRDDCE